MEFEDQQAQCVEELERMVEDHENIMMGFQDYPAKTVEELNRKIEEHERVIMGFEDQPAQCVKELERMVEDQENFMLGFQNYPEKTVEELNRNIEEHERVIMGFEDQPAQCVEELERMVEDHENFMMGFQDYPAKTVEELDIDKREFFKLIYQSILTDLNLSIQDFINLSSPDNGVMDKFEEKELEYIKNNILVNLIKINFNVFYFLDKFELSNLFLFRKMILLQIKIVSYEEESIIVEKTQRGKIEMIYNKKKNNKESLKEIMRKIETFISNGKLEIQGPGGGSLV
jgi:hypothetical protein